MQKDWVDGLGAAQSRLFAAGCVQRVTPLVEAFGTDVERWAWREALDALWTGSEFEPRRVYRAWRARFTAPQLFRHAVTLMGDALCTRFPDPAIAAAGAADTGWAAGDLAGGLAELYPAAVGLVAAEHAAQVETLDFVRRLPTGEAAAAVRAVVHDLGALIASIEEPAALPLGPRPAPRPRHAGHAASPGAPVAAPPHRQLVAEGDSAFVPGPDGAPPFRSGDVLRLALAPADTLVAQAHDDRLTLRHPWRPDALWSLPRHPDPTTSGDNWTPARIEPDPATLATGDACRVAIDATVYLVEAYTQVPRRATAPVALLVAWPLGVEPLGGYGRYDEPLDPYAMPLRVDLVHRAYPFLAPGERVLDADGTALEFRAPLLFLPPGADLADPARWPVAQVPRWPLRRADGTPVPETAAGCHDEQAEAWEATAGVTLPAEYDVVPWFQRIGERSGTYRGW